MGWVHRALKVVAELVGGDGGGRIEAEFEAAKSTRPLIDT
jgi:hypothetical protein